MSDYKVYATPHFSLTCPKHQNYMTELRNGLFGETLWWCAQCERPYHLKPTALRLGQFDREAVDKQLKEKTK